MEISRGKLDRKKQPGIDPGAAHASGWRTGGSRILSRATRATEDVERGIYLDAERFADLVIVLRELDQLFDYLPQEKIREFARSEAFDRYQRLFESIMNLPVDRIPTPEGEGPGEAY